MAIGSLAVRVSADTSRFANNMNKSRRPAQNLRSEMKQVGKRAGKMAAAMTAAGAAIAAQLTRKGLAAVDSQAKLARQLGETQAAIAGTTRAAKDAGVEQGQLESNLEAMNKRLGEAVEGSGQASDTLDRLGLSARELAEMPLDQRLDTIGAEINKLGTEAERASATADIFSRSGLDMVNVFAQGEGAIQDATAEMQGFGVAVTDVDASQVEAANDAMSRIGDVVQGVANQLAVNMAPLLEGMAGLFTDAARESQGFGDEISAAIQKGIRVSAFLADAVEGVRRTFVIAGQAVATFALSVVREGLRAAETIMSGPVDAINALIDTANNIPHIEFDKVEQPDIVHGLRSELEIAEGAVEEGKRAMHETLMEPMPGEAMREWATDVQEQSRETNESVVEDRENERARSVAIRQIMARQFGDIDQQVTDREGEQNEQRLARMREFLGERAETEVQDHEARMGRLREMLDEELITKEQFQDREKQLKAQHENELLQIALNARREEEKQNSRFAKANAAIRNDQMSSEIGALRSGLRTMFGDNKAAALAMGALKRFEAITSAYAWGSSLGGPPAGAAAAATAAAAQASTLGDMGSTSIGSSNAGSSQPAAGSTSAPAQGGGGGGGSTPGGPATMINLQGDSFGRDQVRDLLERINEEGRDGGRLVIN